MSVLPKIEEEPELREAEDDVVVINAIENAYALKMAISIE